jgi:hypothetical protein
MTTERDALADEQAYGIATKVMAGWPVPTISMYAALVRAGYRAALAAPARCIIAACPDDPVRIGLCAHHLALIEGQAAQPDNDQTGGAGIPSSSALGKNRSALPPDPTAAPAQDVVAQRLAQLLASQKPLEPEFAKVLHDNFDSLIARDAAAPAQGEPIPTMTEVIAGHYDKPAQGEPMTAPTVAQPAEPPATDDLVRLLHVASDGYSSVKHDGAAKLCHDAADAIAELWTELARVTGLYDAICADYNDAGRDVNRERKRAERAEQRVAELEERLANHP